MLCMLGHRHLPVLPLGQIQHTNVALLGPTQLIHQVIPLTSRPGSYAHRPTPSLSLEWSQVTHISASIKSGGAYKPEKSQLSTVPLPDYPNQVHIEALSKRENLKNGNGNRNIIDRKLCTIRV